MKDNLKLYKQDIMKQFILFILMFRLNNIKFLTNNMIQEIFHINLEK